jgi:hypothetical protein
MGLRNSQIRDDCRATIRIVETRTWTDERLDDLSTKVDRGFERVDRGFIEVRAEIRATRSDLTAQIDSLRNLTIRLSLGTALMILVAIATRSL